MNERGVTPNQRTTLSIANEYCPFASTHLNDPYAFYKRARLEEPVFFSEELHAWVVTRYDDIKAVLSQPTIFSSKDTLRPVTELTPETLAVLRTGHRMVPFTINTDGVEHMRFRVGLDQVFTPGKVKAMEGLIRGIANRLIDDFINDGKVDIIDQFASPLPVEVILTLFGVPQDQLSACKQWSDDFSEFVSGNVSPERQVECAHSIVAFQCFLDELIEERRRNPKDDLVSHLLAARYADERPLDLEELPSALTGALLAGHETTTHLIANALRILLTQPDLWQTLISHPEYIPRALEEVLRVDSPVQTFFRTALQEVNVGSVTVPEGALLLLIFGSANYDETQFQDPDQFIMLRSPNRHLSFGYGVHYCVGAPLGRLEGRIALETLSQRLPSLRLRPGQTFSYVSSLMFRALQGLEIEWAIV